MPIIQIKEQHPTLNMVDGVMPQPRELSKKHENTRINKFFLQI